MQRRIYSLTLLCMLAAACLNTRASAQTTFFANLTNDQENPSTTPTLSAANGGGPRPASFGTATFTLNAAQTALSFSATIFNIDFTGTQTADTNDNLLNAHIHAGPLVTPTTNGPVVWGFRGAPFNDNNPNDVVFSPFATGVGGTISGKWDAPEGNNTTLAAQVPNLLAGRAYINFHTMQFTGGEVRGQILAVAPVPEPGSVALLVGLGAVGAGFLRRRKIAQKAA